MPHCYTTFEELVYTFGGPWLFGFMLLSLLILFALVLSVARVKLVGGDELSSLVPARHGGLQLDRSVPFLESLNEVYFQVNFIPQVTKWVGRVIGEHKKFG